MMVIQDNQTVSQTWMVKTRDAPIIG